MSTPQTDIPTIWTTGYCDVLDTGTWRAALPVHAWRPSPCHVDCPIDNAIPRFIKRIDEGDAKAAWLELVQTNPFPAVTGRVCHRPCEGHCNRAVMEAAVGINSLEQYLGDTALAEGWELPHPGKSQGKRVAIVGGGPAGLSAAYHLRRLGYEVTLFEAQDQLGGLLREGIPEYRLAASVVEAEIQRVLTLGVEVRTSSAVTDAVELEQLRSKFDAVFLALGAQRAKRLPFLEEAAPGRVLDGLDYLHRCVEGAARDLGKRLVVIGGGSAAMDVARTARRLGHTVTVVAFETRAIMPAQANEVDEALEEGIALFGGAMVLSATSVAGGGLALTCQKVTLDIGSPPGVIRPIPTPGSEFILKADVIVTAIGQDPELAGFGPALPVAEAGGVVAVDPTTLAVSGGSLFAGGDVASMLRYVSVAIGAGRRAAYGIAQALDHPEAAPPPAYMLEQAVNRAEVNVFYFDLAGRNERTRADAEARLAGFGETVTGYADETAAAEAARCMTCGTCIECDNCFVFCPDTAVKKDQERETHYVILDQYCKGCGLCAAECPRGAVHLEAVTR